MSTDNKEVNPYVGPRPFERNVQDRARFFGRDRETQEIVSLIFGHPLVLVYAQSGAGKTSLFNAKVAPTLERNGFEVLPLTSVRGVTPEGVKPQDIANLYVFSALLNLEPEADPWALVDKSLAAFLEERPRPTSAKGKPVPRVIVFDQFEELFTLYPERWREQQEAFFRQVAEALDADPLLRSVFVLREDYLAQLDSFARLLPERLRTRFRLERLRKEAALAAIRGPLRDTRRSFAEGVAEQLIEELLKARVATATGKTAEVTGEFVEPVQLQVVCQSLWQDLPSDVTIITQDQLQAFGDVNQALSGFYERSIKTAAQESGVSERDLRAWFEDTLITPAGTRGTVYQGGEETGGIPNATVGVLENLHLIRGERRAGARWYELTHDRFIGPIQRSNEAWRAVRRGRWLRIGGGVAFAVLILLLVIAILRTTEATQKVQQSEEKLTAVAVAVTQAANTATVEAAKTASASATQEAIKRIGDLQTTKDGSGQDFSGYNLTGLDLSGANLNRAILHATTLRNANLKIAILTEANLTAADLQGADLTRADLRNAILDEANLRGATLTCTNLLGADLTRAKLDDKWVKIANLLTTGDGQGQDFSGYDLSQVGLERANLQGATLTQANLDNACLSNADLTEADLTNASLRQADLSGAELIEGTLSQAKISGASLIQSDLSGADLSGADLSMAFLTGVDLSGAQLESADLRGADLTEATLNETKGLGNLFYDDHTIWPAGFAPPVETPVPQPTATASPSQTLTPSPTSTPSPGTIVLPVGTSTATPSSTPTRTATPSSTPTGTATPTPLLPTSTPEPAFPADEQIVFISTRRGGSNLFIVGASGEGQRLERPAEWILLGPCHKFFDGCFEAGKPRFRPGSKQFLFHARTPRAFDIFLAQLSVGQAEVTENLTSSEEPGDIFGWDQFDGTWSPKGDKIAFVSTYKDLERIWLMDPNGDNPIPLTSGRDYKDEQPAWSPTGEWIATSSQPSGSSAWELFLVNPNDGSQRRQITDTGGANRAPMWSPDGTRLAFARGKGSSEPSWTFESSDICIINSDGSSERCRQTLWPEDLPSWSPDGNWIVFHRWVDATYRTEIFIMREDFGEEHRVTYNEADDWGPAWVPVISTFATD